MSEETDYRNGRWEGKREKSKRVEGRNKVRMDIKSKKEGLKEARKWKTKKTNKKIEKSKKGINKMKGKKKIRWEWPVGRKKKEGRKEIRKSEGR